MAGTSEIVECVGKTYNHGQTSEVLLPGQRYSIEDDINKLFKAIELRNSCRVSGQQEGHSKGALDKSAMKRPMRMGSPQASGIGISESTSLKQALRGLCISQASEMAAVKKRFSKSAVSRHSEAGTMKRPYCHPLNEGRGNLVEICLVPECNTSLTTVANRGIMEHIDKTRQSNCEASSSHSSAIDFKEKGKAETPTQEELVCVNDFCDLSDTGLNLKHSSDVPSSVKKLHVLDEADVQDEPISREKEEYKQRSQPASRSLILVGTKAIRFATTGPRLMRPFFRSKNFLTKKITGTTAITQSSSSSPCNAEEICHTSDSTVKNGCVDIVGTPEPIIPGAEIEVSSKFMDSSADKSSLLLNSYSRSRSPFRQGDEISGSRETGDLSQSSLSSYGDYSSTTSSSEDSCLSRSNRSGSKPHMSKDLRWKAIHSIQKQHGSLGLRHFKLLKKLGGGDIGNVYLSEIIGTDCLFAVKVMDNHLLTSRNKINRAQTEQEILQMLDHPFLPSLYAHFRTDKFSCLVIEYCPGGDLHVLRQKQLSRSFSEQSARFYIAEVLLALEYLHMLGVVYRDLKPENVLVREDGHIMLTDFDLSLICVVNPTLLKSSTPVSEPPKKAPSHNSESSCIDPFCLQPSWQMSCFNPRFLSAASKTRKLKSDLANQVSFLPQLIVEPTSARSNSFVGTHEYLAPEIIRGEGHGSAVDWWTLGIFAYELLYGKTPFKGAGNDDTLSNVVSQCLRFPACPIVSTHARDLIRRLLQKEPESRLGSEKGAAEIKQHPFFEGLNWALIRCTTPPDVPKCYDLGKLAQDKENGKCVKEKECRTIVEDTVFDMF